MATEQYEFSFNGDHTFTIKLGGISYRFTLIFNRLPGEPTVTNRGYISCQSLRTGEMLFRSKPLVLGIDLFADVRGAGYLYPLSADNSGEEANRDNLATKLILYWRSLDSVTTTPRKF